MKPETETFGIERIIEGLQEPDCYRHPVETVRVIQTHASCVFLTGRFAYKVKKPVDFGFLDYSTPERRRSFCQQELRLNQRLCPDIYLDVVPLTVENGRLRVGGDGTPVEWAVRMQQMDDTDLLSARLETDTIDRIQIERIALVLANFHTRAQSGPAIRAFGRPDAVLGVIAGTLHVMDTIGEGAVSAEARWDIRASLENFQRQEAELLLRRMNTGAIRDCHGDLRAQNICLDGRFDGGIQIFDCIEFNDAFRYIDTAADLAYLAMDLDLAGRADLRECLVNTYQRAAKDSTDARAAEDSDLRKILPFYQTYRACVRANIALLAAAEQEVVELERVAHQELAAAAYDLAWCYSGRRRRPALLITVGFSGSGKSRLAWELCRRLPAVLLSSDRIRKERAGLGATDRLGPAQYTEVHRAAVYAELGRRAALSLGQGENVLLDATFLSEHERGAAADLAQTQGAEFWVLECRCPDAVIRRRLASRRRDPHSSDASLPVYEEQLRSFQPLTPPAPEGSKDANRIVINTDQPVPSAARGVVHRFLSPPGTGAFEMGAFEAGVPVVL
jgi:aminoglycoside phosphotransferase family enzyme/predicted kinase